MKLPFQKQIELEPVVFRQQGDEPAARPWFFMSLRWKIILPLLALALTVSMGGAYLVSDAVARGVHDNEIDHLQRTTQAVMERMGALSTLHRQQLDEVLRVARPNIAANLLAGTGDDGRALHPVLEPLATAHDLDYLLVYGADGHEVIGLQRVIRTTGAVEYEDYAVADDTDLGAVLPARGGAYVPDAVAQPVIVRTLQGYALMTAGPVLADDTLIGSVLVGTRLDRVLVMLRGGDTVELTLFGGADGEFLHTTFALEALGPDALYLPADALDQVQYAPDGTPPIDSLKLSGDPYNVAYVPLVIDGTPLGVVAIYAEDDTFYATALSRQTASVVAAILAGGIVVVAFLVMGRFTGRLERIMATAHALAAGDKRARTGMTPGDEIGELGAALDRMAGRHQRRTDTLQRALRRQRTETSRLNAILESIPDGIVVQDLDGRVLLINDAARELMGGQRVFRAARLHELTAVVTEKLGPALAPGIYALGDPTRLPLDGKMLQAQAAAILTRAKERIGTVIVLRDITAAVEREQARERLLDELSERAVAPSAPQSYDSLSALAKEVVRNTRSLQRVIAELRDLSTFEPRDLQAGQRPLPLNDLLWHIAAEWQPLARSAEMRLQVRFGPRGQHVLGDDRRLRWAVGNLVDNALKYSPPGTVITLAARVPEENPALAEITVEDTGYGITPEDLENAFTRFYRGTPRDAEGKPVRKPGTGQGLFIARRVIQAHGGEITLESQAGIGTTAVVRLPLTAPVTLEMPDAAGDADRPATVPEAGRDEDDIELSAGGPYDTVPLDDPPRPVWTQERKGD